MARRRSRAPRPPFRHGFHGPVQEEGPEGDGPEVAVQAPLGDARRGPANQRRASPRPETSPEFDTATAPSSLTRVLTPHHPSLHFYLDRYPEGGEECVQVHQGLRQAQRHSQHEGAREGDRQQSQDGEQAVPEQGAAELGVHDAHRAARHTQGRGSHHQIHRGTEGDERAGQEHAGHGNHAGHVQGDDEERAHRGDDRRRLRRGQRDGGHRGGDGRRGHQDPRGTGGRTHGEHARGGDPHGGRAQGGGTRAGGGGGLGAQQPPGQARRHQAGGVVRTERRRRACTITRIPTTLVVTCINTIKS